MTGTSRFRTAALFMGGLLIGIGLLKSGLIGALTPGRGVEATVVREMALFGIGAAMLAWVAFAERLPLSSIGLKRPTIGSAFVTISPSSSNWMRSTPCVDGCDGPMERDIFSGSNSLGMVAALAAASGYE